SFTSTTVAPTVQIVSPVPNRFVARGVSPVVRIEWQGDDADGVGSRQPVSYRWKLLSASSEFPAILALPDPDSLRRFYAPSFAGWDSVGGETHGASLRDLVPGHIYLFVVVAFDQAGAYSPLFSADVNMLQLSVDLATSLGPRITIVGSTFSYTFP